MSRKVSSVLALCVSLAILTPANAQVGTGVDLPATGQWVNTGIDVHKGDALHVALSTRELTVKGKIGAVKFAATANCVAPATGRLFLRINRAAGASGSVSERVQVSISHASTAAAKPLASTFVPLPNVVGMKFPAAARSLRDLGLVPRRQKRASSRPAGIVLDQSPEPGADAHTVKAVTLGVSDGSLAETGKPVESTFIPLPNYVGMRFPAAARSLKEFGLAARRQTRSSSRPAGAVVGQAPAPGVNARSVKIVILAVSDGSLAQTVPKTRTTLPHRRATPEPVPTAPPTSVAAMPAPTPTTAPRLTVSPAPGRTTTARPRKTTRPRATARSSAPVTRVPPRSTAAPLATAVPSAVGFAQQAAPSLVKRSTPPAAHSGENVVPNLQGRSVDDARALLKKSGFRLGSVVSHGAAGEPIAKQYPVAGARASVDSAVDVTVDTPRRGWTWWLLGAGAVLVLLGLGSWIGNRMRVARMTSRRLAIHSSLELDGPTGFDGNVPMEGPATHLRASLEDGEVSFEEPGDIIMREEHDG